MVKIVAEVGLNWNGDINLLEPLIRSARHAGCDALKFQNYRTESFIHQRSEWWEYENNGKIIRERQFDMFKRHEITFDHLIMINDICKHWNMEFSSTPMCLEGLQDLISLGVPWVKNGSDCLQDIPLIHAMAKSGIPTVISTGMATDAEISNAIDEWDYHSKGQDLTVLHCVSAYPAKDEDMNLEKIRTLSKRFDCHAGLSDHSEGITAAVLSVAYGATFIEKHYTLDKNMQGPDHRFSADPKEMKDLVDNVRRAEKMIGNGKLGMTKTEEQNRKIWFKNA